MDFRKTGDGFAYMLVGDKHAVQMVVSLYSLRSFWRGPVALIVGDSAAENVARLCQTDARLGPLSVVVWDAPRGGGKGLQHANKTYIGELTPFARTAFLDADTLVTGDPTDLFPADGSDEIRLTRFANWSSNERPVRGRVETYRELCPELVDRAQNNPFPAINTGTFGISIRSTDYLLTWAHYSRTLPKFMSDELVAQIIFPDFPHVVLDERWNCSPIFSWPRYAPPKNADVRIWHGHGWKFISRKTGRQIWWPAYDRARTDNVAKLAEWTPGADRRLAKITGQLERGESVR